MKLEDVDFYCTRSVEDGTAYGVKNKTQYTVLGRETKTKEGRGRGGSQKQDERKVGEERESPLSPSAPRVDNKQQAGKSGGRGGSSGDDEIAMLSSQQPHHGTQVAENLRPRTKPPWAVVITDDEVPAHVLLGITSSKKDGRVLPVALLSMDVDDGRGA